MRHVRVDPRLIERTERSQHELQWLGAMAGYHSPQTFSRIINSGMVPRTQTSVVRLRRLAKVLDFPPDMVFVEDFVPEPPRRRKTNDFVPDAPARKVGDFSEIPPAPGVRP